eukprot:1708370-Amphidinium_carterae.1
MNAMDMQVPKKTNPTHGIRNAKYETMSKAMLPTSFIGLCLCPISFAPAQDTKQFSAILKAQPQPYALKGGLRIDVGEQCLSNFEDQSSSNAPAALKKHSSVVSSEGLHLIWNSSSLGLIRHPFTPPASSNHLPIDSGVSVYGFRMGEHTSCEHEARDEAELAMRLSTYLHRGPDQSQEAMREQPVVHA